MAHSKNRLEGEFSNQNFSEWQTLRGYRRIGGALSPESLDTLPDQTFHYEDGERYLGLGDQSRAIVMFRRPKGIPDNVWEEMNGEDGLGDPALKRFLLSPSDRGGGKEG